MTAKAQESTHNHISEKVYTNAAGTTYNQTITYYDGLGRPMEIVKKGAWLNGNTVAGDIVSMVEYDQCGRPCLKTLPAGVEGNDGAFAIPIAVHSAAVYQYGDFFPYTEVQYDSIPFDRVRTEWGAGADWRFAGNSVSRSYHSNRSIIPDRNPVMFAAEYSGDTEVVLHTDRLPYVDEEFRIEEVKDEDGRCKVVYTNAFGDVGLERRTMADSTLSDTQYCYDRAGRLIAVLPPELSYRLEASSENTFTLSSTNMLGQYGYFYRYDNKGQLIAKKLPGAQWIYYIYDKGGRLVYTQDGNQRLKGEWSFVLSDIQGRECIKGTVTKTMSPFNDPLGNIQVFAQRNEPATDMQDYGYLAVNFDMHGADVLSVTWYDDYSFLGNMDGIPSAAPATSPTRFDSSAVSDDYGDKYEYSGAAKVTGKLEKVLGETDGNVYLWTVLYYDDRGRVVQESHSTHRGGWQRTNTGYDFTGHPLKTRTISHDETAGDMTERYTYYYDAWGRPLTVLLALNNYTPSVIHNYTYDGAGRMISDGRNGNSKLATTCAYNVRSWLTDIWVGGNALQGTLGETFTEKLYYQRPRSQHSEDSLQWAGNISAMDWMAGSDGVTRRYDFTYDGLSRLTSAGYTDDDNGTGFYSRSYTYDRNGNITSVTTPSATTQLYYSGNQFAGGGNYSYDANGNLTEDLDRLISYIKYNVINLPSEISTCDEVSGNGILSGLDGRYYLYTAGGIKLQEKETNPPILAGFPDNRARTDYVGNLIYDRTSLKKVLFPGGYAEASGTGWLYRFFVTDHLGNNRIVTDASGTILQTNHYDPYGESLPAGASVDSGNPYKWGGKEYVSEQDSYDFGARYYTTSIPRWTTMDPLCEKYYSISPYAYCAGNPVNLVDPDGLDWYIFDSEGQYIGKEEHEGDHRLAIKSTQNTTSGKEYTEYQLLSFADSVNDPKSIEDGLINRVVFVSDETIKGFLLSQSVFESGLDTFIKRSEGGGLYDYSYSVLVNNYETYKYSGDDELKSQYIFLPEGEQYVHNIMNFGNFLWAATGYTLGLPSIVLQVGAHGNSLINSKKNGYKPQLDSRDDQLSIKLGAAYARKMGYRKE